MINYDFEILKTIPLKGHKIAGTKDYETNVRVIKDEKDLFNEIIMVRKNKSGVFPEMDIINEKISSPSLKKDLNKHLKEFIKKKGK